MSGLAEMEKIIAELRGCLTSVEDDGYRNGYDDALHDIMGKFLENDLEVITQEEKTKINEMSEMYERRE